MTAMACNKMALWNVLLRPQRLSCQNTGCSLVFTEKTLQLVSEQQHISCYAEFLMAGATALMTHSDSSDLTTVIWKKRRGRVLRLTVGGSQRKLANPNYGQSSTPVNNSCQSDRVHARVNM